MKCFALREDGSCNALKYKQCIGYKNCSFYKTKKQFVEDDEKARNRRKERK